MDINMPINSSSFVNHSSSNVSLHLVMNTSYMSKMSIFVLSVLITNLLLLPLFILIFYLGYQQRRKQHNVSTAATMSHSDFFMYHSIIMHLNTILGVTFFICGSYINLQKMKSVGLSVWSVTSLGQAVFHLLTCVERYLAVVHPITYRGLRQTGGVRIRNISIGCVWLLCLGWTAVLYLTSHKLSLIFCFCILIFFLIVVSFCSIAVLCTLKQPGPGEVGGNRERVDQSKQRAFHIIMAIMGVLLFRFGGNLIAGVISSSAELSPSVHCVVVMTAYWFELPSSLVLPLLFLHRAGKLQCCKNNTESG